MPTVASRVGRRGTIVIPAEMQRGYGLEEGSLIVAEARPEGILIRPAVALPTEVYSDERKAEFLLSNAVDTEEYAWAVAEVRKAPGGRRDASQIGSPVPAPVE